ncbi:MAG: peptidylglycine alpha-amidating monooxygenase [Chloroflexi bacterium]|nr:peptidylglycine alpha-amidating monooxygenase [Chloroflexota bacterium]|tara:strand:+ start:230 stop:1198 length:969 start_codon:yes stop_codon:yes gene_type:complete
MKNLVDSTTKFAPVDMWAKIPMGVTFRGDATSIAVDSEDNVYVFNRGNYPIAVFDKDGDFIRGFGHGDFVRPHGIEIDLDDNIYLVDDDGHFIQKRNNDGEILFTLGEKGKPCRWQSGGMFNRPTDIAIHPISRDLFISDGYGNSRIHKFDSDGKHILSWGSPGTEPGEFSLPHNITILGNDKVAVCDRENFRVQIFSLDGEYIKQIHIHHPMSITEGKKGDDRIYVGEMLPPPVQQGVPNLGAKISILNPDGQLIQQIGDSLPGEGLNQFTSPHGISTDSEGSIYVAEVAWTAYFSRPENSGLNNPPLGEVISLRKWIRTS